ncbi:MAG: sulfurtransferase TusA family protein [Pseudomonadales bacterium]|nr:sulfurtransferase TusA family protein [Pseudomonadales bacterium]
MIILDARGMRCPMPLLKLKQSLHQLNVAEVLTVMTTDPMSKRDFVAFLQRSPHKLLSITENDSEICFEIQKGE